MTRKYYPTKKQVVSFPIDSGEPGVQVGQDTVVNVVCVGDRVAVYKSGKQFSVAFDGWKVEAFRERSLAEAEMFAEDLAKAAPELHGTSRKVTGASNRWPIFDAESREKLKDLLFRNRSLDLFEAAKGT